MPTARWGACLLLGRLAGQGGSLGRVRLQLHANLGLNPAAAAASPAPWPLSFTGAAVDRLVSASICGRLPQVVQPTRLALPCSLPEGPSRQQRTAATLVAGLHTVDVKADLLPGLACAGLPCSPDPEPEPQPASVSSLLAGHPPAASFCQLPAQAEPVRLPSLCPPWLIGRSVRHSSLAALAACCPAHSAPSRADLAQLAEREASEQLLAAELTMQAMPDLLPLPFLPCVDAPCRASRGRWLIQACAALKSTSCKELYLDWISTAAFPGPAVEREVAALPGPRRVCRSISPGAAVLGALLPLPQGLHHVLAAASASRLQRCRALTSASGAAAHVAVQANASREVLGQPAAAGAQAAQAPAAPALRAGLSFLTGLRSGKQAGQDAHASASAGGTGQQTGAEVLRVSLSEPHIGLLLQLQERDRQTLQQGAGLAQKLR